jgi:hypothetical protein
MAFTDNCDVFVSFHEDGFNRLIFHAMRQRPSLFNYATASIAANPERLCEVIDVHPVVPKRGNPFVTVEDLLPIPGSNYGLEFAVQIRELVVDFHPGTEFALPPELSPPLGAQRLALKLRFCAGLGCPPDEIVDRLIPIPPNPNRGPNDPTGAGGTAPRPPRQDIQPLPFRRLLCFCIEVYVTGGVTIKQYWGKPYLEPFLSGVEIVDLAPKGLEDSLECYIKLLLKLVVLPKLRILLERAPLDIMQLASVTISPTPAPAGVPNNPAIEADQLKAFIDVEVS